MDIAQYSRNFTPDTRLRTKYVTWGLSLWFSVSVLINGFFGVINYFDETFPTELLIGTLWLSGITLVVLVVVVIPFIFLYYPTIRYEVVENEIHVFRGIITKTRKVVPYRTITNMEIKRGIFDRFFGIGTIEIQTAGNSNPNKGGPEETIDGIPNEYLLPLQNHIISMVRGVSGSPGTSHDTDPVTAILAELRDLKLLLKERLH